MKFDSTLKILGEFGGGWTQDAVKNEPMLFNCDFKNAYRLGGPITRNFLWKMPWSGRWDNEDVVIDSRVHMLMPNWFPCIPGFHHDGIPRNQDQYWQPNYINPEYHSEHLMGLVNGDICPTEFAIGEIELDIPPPEKTIYAEWHPLVEEALKQKKMESFSCPSGVYVQFDCNTFHQGTKAIGSGWRWFIRVSRKTDRTRNCTNEIRKQVQVYLEHPMQGW